MKTQYCLLFLLIFFLGCSRTKPDQRKNEITKIEIATGSCFGPCQPTIVSIDSSLEYKYWGLDYSTMGFNHKPDSNMLEGYYRAKISKAYWDTLNIKLEKIKYKQLDTSYEHTIDDQSLEVFVYYGNKKKHIKAQSASLPDSVAKVFYYIVNSYKTIKPKPTTDTLHFESTLHVGPPKPPTGRSL